MFNLSNGVKHDKGRGLFTCITLTAYESHYEMPPVVYIIVGKTGRSARAHTNTHQPQLPDSLARTEGKWRDLSLWLVITSKIREHTLLCNCSGDRKKQTNAATDGGKNANLSFDVPRTEARSLVSPHLSSCVHL